MTMALLGKRVLITGAASGIGREAAFSFAELGASLELSDIDEAGLERTAMLCRKLGAASGITVTTHRVDVASPSDMKRMAEDVHRRIDALD
ncbi:MAG TPA: SDR family NAD(P)-dependent oxidoreductase, partial [Polyangiales bacterium]|nr:SDR family NAD(P)-dependent oxidoreductase [Polyangiales bacterium]